MSVSKTSRKPSRGHPLQRLQSPGKGFSGIVHALGLFSFCSSFKYLMDHPNIMNESYGWHFQYLTIIGLTTCTLSFFSGLLADITSSGSFFHLKNYFAIVAAPIEMLISTLYWGLRAIDPSLVLPPDMPTLPILDDFGFHLFPTLLLAVDVLLLSPPWTITPLMNLGVTTGLSFTYWFWIELCFKHNGFYPYPIFALLSTPQRVLLFAGSGVGMWIAGWVLRSLYTVINGLEEPSVTGENKDL